ncbi:hypothetical protein O0I10_002566 [Lichtheimia ornata]|uniref:Uncharacterized protein n=1 Tax=Lichtheimia ornata TaxID=688661 RepID=A0AAD7XYE2_9FUNG|nr:uncharacterized protein O0I10_002566 [Lichtheimia ornata]KAJ8661759.1 hypothetical protein O0I10_002566 [Lichtheimia ornata]
MSPRPEYEPDENEPDEDESPDPKTMHNQSTPTPSSGHDLTNARPSEITSQTSSSSSSLQSSDNSSSSMAPSTIGPLVVALVVILVIITCCIIHCSRIRKRLNDEQRTQTINGWTSFMTWFQQPKQQHRDLSHGEEKNVIVHVNDADSGLQHRLSKPPPMSPYDDIQPASAEQQQPMHAQQQQYQSTPPPKPPPLDTKQRRRHSQSPSDERQPSIVFSSGWVFATNNSQSPNTPEPAATLPSSQEAHTERLCPHQITVDDDNPMPVITQKPHAKADL